MVAGAGTPRCAQAENTRLWVICSSTRAPTAPFVAVATLLGSGSTASYKRTTQADLKLVRQASEHMRKREDRDSSATVCVDGRERGLHIALAGPWSCGTSPRAIPWGCSWAPGTSSGWPSRRTPASSPRAARTCRSIARGRRSGSWPPAGGCRFCGRRTRKGRPLGGHVA